MIWCVLYRRFAVHTIGSQNSCYTWWEAMVHAICNEQPSFMLYVVGTQCSCYIGWEVRAHGPLARYVKLRVAHAPGMPGTFSRHRRLAIPAYIRARASRTYRDACRDRKLADYFGVGAGEDVPGIPGACATRNFTYLVRGPCYTRWEARAHAIYDEKPAFMLYITGS